MSIQNVQTKLEATHPALMFPVRLETRYPGGGKIIQIRVIPDVCHLNSHRPGLSDLEAKFGTRYWQLRGEAVRNKGPVEAIFADLASHFGVTRAAWVARETKPLNWNDARPPKKLTPPTITRDERPSTPVAAALLPQAWFAAAFVQGEIRSTAVSRPVNQKIAVAPDFAAEIDPDADALGFMKQQGLEWMFDFRAAFDNGMGIKLPLTPAMRDGVDELIVVGIPRVQKPLDRAAEIEQQLVAHRYTQGLELLRRGTPTNITDGTDGPSQDTDIGSADAAVGPPSVTAYEHELSRPLTAKTGRSASRLATAWGLSADTVLARTRHADDRQLDIAADMRKATWHALEGHFLTGIIAQVTPPAITRKITDLGLKWHRPGGHLPALQIGAQPYGILAVAHPFRGHDDSTMAAQVEQLVSTIERHYLDLTSTPRIEPLPMFDPAAPALSLDDYLANVAKVIASEPNPADLSLRTAEWEKYGLFAQWLFLILLLDIGMTHFPLEQAEFLAADTDTIHGLHAALFNRWGLESDLDNLALPHTPERVQAAEALVDLLNNSIGPAIEERIDLVNVLEHVGRPGADGLYGSDNPTAIDVVFDDESRPWNAPAAAHPGTTADDLADWCTLLADSIGGDPPPAPQTPAPLLWVVLRDACRRAPQNREPALRSALKSLGRNLRGSNENAVADAELTLREILGGASTRLDAWRTVAANMRLATLARKVEGPLRPHISAWGVVTDLRKGLHGRSDGFVPTPSITHAATAAVLRSGWQSVGDEAHNAALSVDLSSDRVQRAVWLTDGIRAGRPLGDLLGARLERRLQDKGLHAAVDVLRATHAAERNIANVTVVDGVCVARAWSDGVAERTPFEQKLHETLDDLVAADPEAAGAFDETLADLDAIGDVSVAQSVHALVQGEYESARASVEAITTGAVNPPMPTMVESTPSFTLVDHLVALVVPEKAAWEAPNNARAAGDPAADRLASTVIADPGDVALLVIAPDEEIVSVSLQQANIFGVGALDIVMDLTAAGTLTGPTRERLIANAGIGFGGDEASVVTRVGDTHRQQAAVWHQVGIVLGEGRPATTADLTPPGLRDAADPHASSTGDDAWHRDLLDRLDRLDDLGDPLIPARTELPRGTIAECETALRARLGPLPLLRSINTPGWLTDTINASEHGVAETADVLDWAGTTGLVRRPLRRLCDVIDGDEAHGAEPWKTVAAQTSGHPDWIATSHPGASGGSNIVLVGPQSSSIKKEVTAVVIDAWNDSAPNQHHTAAAAVHFDQPEGEAPNLILMATVPNADVWDAHGLVFCARAALEQARLRMLGPDGVQGLGQYLPTTFLSADTGTDQE